MIVTFSVFLFRLLKSPRNELCIFIERLSFITKIKNTKEFINNKICVCSKFKHHIAIILRL